MTERQEDLVHLTERVGVGQEEAELMLDNDDLWLTYPSERFVDTDPEEEALQWVRAENILEDASTLVLWSSPAAFSALSDAMARCRIAAERSRVRAASGE